MSKKFFSLVLCLFVSMGMAFAQTVQLSGRVTDSDTGEPVVGAAVQLKGSTTSYALTDNEGRYSFRVPSDGIITVSSLGYKPAEIAVNGQNVINITLQSEARKLDDVVVVAYGTAKKESFTGSAATVSSETLEKVQVSNVSKALEGAAPGVQVAMQSGQPGSSATIRIRGIGSINSSSEPLYVVDGMPYDGNISAINPADIQSISVLKDAASTSLYGSRAANGVIIITTKKGSVNKSKVTFDARVGLNTRGVPEYDIMKDPGMYMTTYWTMLKNQLGDGAQASAQLYNDLGYNPFKCANDAIVDSNGNLTTAALKWNDDWEEEALRTGIRQEYGVTVQGGSEKSTHYLSLGYLDDEGIIKNSDYSRLSFRASGDYDVTSYLKLNGTVSYARGEQNSQAISSLANYVNTFMFTQMIAPIYPVYAYDENGNRLYDEDGDVIYDFGDGTYGTRAYASNQNVVATDKANMNRLITDNVSSRFGATLTFLKDFKFQTNFGYDLTNNMRDRFQTPSFGDAKSSGGRGYKTRSRIQTYTLNELLTYTKSINDMHHIDVLVGHENYNMKYNYLYNSKTKFFSEDIPEYSNAITMETMDSYYHKYTIESYLARLNYDYDYKYYLSASVRRDGSSRFSKDNRWGTFWSVGGSWRLSKEAFMQDISWLNNLTLRASYGSVGNDDIYYPGTSVSNYYADRTQYSITNSDGAFSVSRYYYGNPDLTWETSYSFNTGLTASMFDNMITLDFEYFNKRTEDMLYNVPQPMSSGISYISENALTMTNKGFEFTLGVDIPMPEDFSWSWEFTGTHYKNKVTDIPEDKRESGITHGAYYNIREGRSVYDFYYYKFAGLDDTGHPLWYYDEVDENGNVTLGTVDDYSMADKYYIGTALPDFQGGITTNFAWKGIDFSVSANYQIGGKILDLMYNNLMSAGSNAGQNFHKDILNAWTETNTDTDIPILDGDQNANTISDFYLIGADFFNLRNITLGYTFPKKWTKSLSISNARIYFVADNVAIWSKRKGMDPRQYIAGQSDSNYSAIRSTSVGIQLTF